MHTKLILPIMMLLAFTGLARAEDSKNPKSPWSGAVIDSNAGGVGSRTSILKKDVGDGWSVGGQLRTKYQDQNIGGAGAPPPEPFGSGTTKNNTIIGPYFEKKF